MSEALVELFRHHHWANLALADALLPLDEAALAASAEGGYGSIRATYAHLAESEARYLRGLRGEPWLVEPGLDANATIAECRASLDRSGAGLVEVARSGPTEGTIVLTRRGETREYPVALFLVQAIDHAAEHRAQISAVLTQLGRVPPALDGWTFFLGEG